MWIVTLGPSLYLSLPPGVVFKLLGVVIHSGLQLYRFLTTTLAGCRRRYQVRSRRTSTV